MQSYQNVSNSQHFECQCFILFRCKRLCKVIKMLAIHNIYNLYIFLHIVANAFAKLSKCQQFTTTGVYTVNRQKLQTLLQSYQNVSNSQLYFTKSVISASCKRFCKVIKMLAIHNVKCNLDSELLVANAFAKLSKCQQFTTTINALFIITKLQTLLQSYQNVSNSQQGLFYSIFFLRCKRFCKVIKMLAIHNR